MKETNLAVVAQSMSSLQIAEITGKRHDTILRDIRNLLEQGVADRNFAVSEYKDSTGRKLPCYNLTKTGCLILASGYNALLREKIINRWIELESGAATPIGQASPAPRISDRIQAAKFLASFLNLNDASKLLLAKSIADPLGLPTPDYTPSKGVLRSARELLKEHSSALTSEQFNKRMIERGMMTELTRPSSKGGVKKFKSIIGDGLLYGENQVNPQNPKSTQPLYYADSFGKLLAIVASQADVTEETTSQPASHA